MSWLCEQTTNTGGVLLIIGWFHGKEILQHFSLGSPTWKGTGQGFILNWQDKVQQYESILPAKDQLTATIKRNLLENAAGQVQELQAIKTQATQHKTQNTGTELTYEQ
jgi:hypothetical protein